MTTPEDRPSPPESCPKYIAEGLPKQDDETLENIVEYIEALLERRARPVATEELPDNAEPVSEEASQSKGTVVKEWVKCGDDSCSCTSGNQADMHGPYKYRYYRSDGSLTSEYLGKV